MAERVGSDGGGPRGPGGPAGDVGAVGGGGRRYIARAPRQEPGDDGAGDAPGPLLRRGPRPLLLHLTLAMLRSSASLAGSGT